MTTIKTAGEARDAFKAFAAEISAEASLHVSLNTSRWEVGPDALSATAYPRGVGKDSVFTVTADDWSALLTATKEKWAEYTDEHAARTIRAMALAIIRITAELGECTDAALRSEFSEAEVRRHGERACADANDIAGRGPFSITRFGGANEVEAA